MVIWILVRNELKFILTTRLERSPPSEAILKYDLFSNQMSRQQADSQITIRTTRCLPAKKGKSQKIDFDSQVSVDLVAVLDTFWRTEQIPVRLRDSLGKVHGYESVEFQRAETTCG